MPHILFYETGQEYDIFSNVVAIPLLMNINGGTYLLNTSENAYQGIKVMLTNLQEGKKILNDSVTRPSQLGKLARPFHTASFYDNNYYLVNNLAQQIMINGKNEHETLKEHLMYEILLAKFTQNPAILKALLETGDQIIVENTQISHITPKDEFWGNGANGTGRNALGHALMRVRTTLRNELTQNNTIQERVGLSDELAAALNFTQHKPNSQYSGKVISAADLKTIKSVTLTKNLSTQNIQTSPNYFPSVPPKGQTPRDRVKEALEKNGFVINRIWLTNDWKKTKELVVKIEFNDPPAATQFQSQFKCVISKDKPNIVILPQTEAESLFLKLKIAKHGKTASHPMFQALVYETVYERFLSALKQRNFIVTKLEVVPDKNQPRKFILRLQFDNPQATKDFSQFAGNAIIDNENVILGSNRAPIVFQNLEVPLYGLDLFQAIKETIDNQQAGKSTLTNTQLKI